MKLIPGRKYVAGDEIVRILRSHHFYWLPKNSLSHGRKMTHWLWFVFVRYLPIYRPSGTMAILSDTSAGLHGPFSTTYDRKIRFPEYIMEVGNDKD